MKTILIAHNYTQSSFAAMSYNLAHYLADLGHKVIFISHRPYFEERQNIKKEKGEIIVCSWPTLKRPTSIKDFIWFSKMYLEYKPTIIIGHFVGSNISILVSKIVSFGSVKTFEYYHTLRTQILADTNKSKLIQKLLFVRKKIFYQLFCNVIICPSDLAKMDALKSFGVKNGLVIVNPMTDRFLGKNAISNENIYISFLGRFDSSKGIIELIKAFEKFRETKNESKIILNIAGSGSLVAEITKFANKNDSINFVGSLTYDEVDNYLKNSHFTIIPSKFDAFNVVGIESLMNQTPLLISNTTGLSNYLEEGKECFKFSPNIDSMRLLFEKVENNFDKIEQMRLNARATFIEKFGIEKYCEEFSKLLL